MTALSLEQAAHFEGLIDAYEQQREDAQQGLKDTLADLREALAAKLDKTEIAAEVAGLRGAVKKLRMERTNPEKAAKVEEKQDLADQYYFLLRNAKKASTARPHSAQRASLDHAEADATRHDADGVIIERSAPSTPVLAADVDGEGAEPASGPRSDISAEVERSTAEGGSPSPIIEQPAPSPDVTVMGVEKSCGEAEEGARRQSLPTALSLQQGGTTPDNSKEMGVGNVAECQVGPIAGVAPTAASPQDPLPPQVHTTIEGKPLKPAIDPDDLDAVWRARVAAMPDGPAQFRRAPVQGNA